MGVFCMTFDHTSVHKRRYLIAGAVLAICFVVVCGAVLSRHQAIAAHDVDTTTLGSGAQTSRVADELHSSDAAVVSDVQDTSKLSASTARTIDVKDPDPVIVISAIDSSQVAQAAAAQLGTTNPLPTAPHITPSEKEDFKRGPVSAYSHADNDDGKGNFGTDATASGIPLTQSGLTVAVPESMHHMLGHAVALSYNGKVIVATVTDTGGFAGFGRALDLAPGCWKAFGVSSPQEWGVRDIYYKFL